MANKYRGEIDANLDGTGYVLCLTLGALAKLESAFGSDDMLALAGRFSSGRIAAADRVRIIGAGLRGAGNPVPDEAVAKMQGDNGAAGFVDIVARLLAATFGGPVVASDVDGALSAPVNAVSTMAKAEVSTPQARAQMPLGAPHPFHGPR